MTDNSRDQQAATDVNAQQIARVYAEALFNVVEPRGQTAAVMEEFDSFLDDILRSDPNLERFFTTGAVGRNQRRMVLEKVLAGRASESFGNFLFVLNDHERLDLLRPMRQALRELSDAHARRVRVRVQSAVPLADDQQNSLQQLIRETLQLEPILETKVDPELIGGLIIRVGDWQYDATVRNQLDALRSEIIARSSHEIQSRRDRFSSTE